MEKRVAIFANRDSSQAAAIAEAIVSAGGVPLVLDIQLGGSMQGGCTLEDDRLVWDGQDISDVGAVHIRCTAPRVLPCLPPVLHPARWAAYAAEMVTEQAFNAVTHGVFDIMARRGALVVSPLSGVYVDHETKGQFYEKLRDQGFRTPRTLTTTDPASARAFMADVGEAVVKPACGVGSTRLVSEDEQARFPALRDGVPALLQERVTGDVLRVHVVGGRVVSVLRILDGGEVDSRTSTEGFEASEIASSEAKTLASATDFLGLQYAAWDVMRRSDGVLIYLDCNPGPYVMWIPEDQRRDIFDALARLLVTFAETRSLNAARRAVVEGLSREGVAAGSGNRALLSAEGAELGGRAVKC